MKVRGMRPCPSSPWLPPLEVLMACSGGEGCCNLSNVAWQMGAGGFIFSTISHSQFTIVQFMEAACRVGARRSDDR